MYYDPLNTVVTSACLQEPVLIVHNLSGSYFRHQDDLQLVGRLCQRLHLKARPFEGGGDLGRERVAVVHAVRR